MPLSEFQQDALHQAIERYDFPPDYFDYFRNISDPQPCTRNVETKIKADLVSGDIDRMRNGFSNILYWGYARMRLRETRVARFRSGVTTSQLRQAAALFQRSARPTLLELKALRLPEFSGMSFVSKVRMFLDPDSSATLDRQIMKIHEASTETLLSEIRMARTQIPITVQNARGYERWCCGEGEADARCSRARLVSGPGLTVLSPSPHRLGLLGFLVCGETRVELSPLINFHWTPGLVDHRHQS